MLRSNVPGSVRGVAQLIGLPAQLQAWDALGTALRSDASAPAWQIAHGLPFFEYFAQKPEDAAVFQAAMTAFSSAEAEAVAAAYDFGSIGTIVDVGGGHGLLLATILLANPHLSGVLFELPPVVEAAETLLTEHGVADRCAIVTGSFFESVPAGDAHILKNIVHDWQDGEAVAILATCRRATNSGGRLLVVQEALAPGNAPSFGKLLDLEMLVIGGRERTEQEYRHLFEQAGYELTRVVPTESPLHVIEGVAA